MEIGKYQFDVENNVYLWGVLNMTPDSFSDGGSYQNLDKALYHVEKMIREGASVIDVGGESTRPGYVAVSVREEIERVTRVISRIKEEFNVPVSIDTYKAVVAEAAIQAGADIVNDIWGLRYEEKMAEVISRYQVSCCLMHNAKDISEGNIMETMIKDLRETIEIAKRANIDDTRIILDPGIGFAKTYEQNLSTIKHLEQLHTFGYPLLLGASRKSVIGLTLDLGVGERMEGTLVTTVIAVLKGCGFLRVHEIKENARAVRMALAIRDSQ